LLGEHDFSAFAVSQGKGERENPFKEIWKIDLADRGKGIDLTVEGSGFLYKMVRSIVGALLDVGVGKLSSPALRQILKSRKRTEVVVSAPAHGLSLEKVFYGKRKK
jgi:tRNA pseudouridine38-40 synthase